MRLPYEKISAIRSKAQICSNLRTSNTIATNSSHQTINPIGVLLRLAHDDRVTFLEDLMYRNQSLECLNLVGKNGLPAIGDSWSVHFPFKAISLRLRDTYTFMPAQNAADDLWSHV